MRVRFGLLKQYIREAVSMTSTTSPSAPTDPDAVVPGHLPEELPKSASLEEQGWVPGRWSPGDGEPLRPDDAARLGDPVGEEELEETDDRMLGDGKGNGPPHVGGENDELASHLRDADNLSLGSPPEEKPYKSNYDEGHDWLSREIRRYLLQEYPVGAGMVDPVEPPKGFYSDYDQDRDHGDVAKMQGQWSRSPGLEVSDGDPFRTSDPYPQLGFHSPKGPNDGTTHPAVSGEEGVAARKTPEEWTLNVGSDTSAALGAGAKPPSASVGSEDGSEEGEEGEEGEGAEVAASSGEPGADEDKGEEQE